MYSCYWKIDIKTGEIILYPSHFMRMTLHICIPMPAWYVNELRTIDSEATYKHKHLDTLVVTDMLIQTVNSI